MKKYYELNANGKVIGKRFKIGSFDKIYYPYVFKVDILDFENVSNKYTYTEIAMLDYENMILWKWGRAKWKIDKLKDYNLN